MTKVLFLGNSISMLHKIYEVVPNKNNILSIN